MTISQTDLDNAQRDAQDLGKFVNDASGTVSLRTGGTIPNLHQLVDDMGTADVTGPASSTDNAAARFDSITGKLLQNSALLIADTTGALSRSGNGGIPVQGTNTNDSASAGQVGEYVVATLAAGSAVSLTTATAANVTSISLTAGDWNVWGAVVFDTTSTTDFTSIIGATSRTSATLPNPGDDTAGLFRLVRAAGALGSNQDNVFGVPIARMSLASTTTVYLVAQSTFTASTVAVYGFIAARRVR